LEATNPCALLRAVSILPYNNCMIESGRHDVITDNEAVAGLLTDALRAGRSFSFRAGGFSMSPFIKDGDLITVSPFGNMPPGRGDIVAFLATAQDGLTVHRIIKRQGIDFIMKGDSNRAADMPVSGSNLLGRVTGIRRRKTERYLGLGPESPLLAAMSRAGILMPLLRLARLFLLPLIIIIKKSQKSRIINLM
jgi:signal peptidase I